MAPDNTQEHATATGIVAAAGCVCAILVFAHSPLLRLGASLPLVLYLPGRALLEALLPQRTRQLSTQVFAVGLSMSVAILAGLVLHLVGAMSRAGWAAALLAATLGACLVAQARRRPQQVTPPAYASPPLRPVQAAMLVAATLFTIGAVLFARTEALDQREFVYTEFWMVPDGDGLLAVGIKNQEATPSRYEVEVNVNGGLARRWDRIELDVGESWTADFVAPMGSRQNHAAHGAEARLFKDGDQRHVYRSVWLPVSTED